MQRRGLDAWPRRHACAGGSVLTADSPGRAFDTETLNLFATKHEVLIETAQPDGSTRKTRIWVVVDGGEAFVRSVRGDRGHWYQAAMAAPDAVAVHADGQSIPVRVVLADDQASIERCSAALRSKYNPGGSLDSMLVDKTLGTTLRLEPR